MILLRYLYLTFFVRQTLQSRAQLHWMYSKSWIEDYRIEVGYGSPSQSAQTEFSLETHKIGVIQREDEESLGDGGYDYRESMTVLASLSINVVHNKGDRYEGRLISDFINVPENLTHKLPNLMVNMVLLEKVNEGAVNFIGLLEAPENDGYSYFSTSLRNNKKITSICYIYVLCGNYRRGNMLSIGIMQVHYSSDTTFSRSGIQDAAVIDPYVFMVVVKSMTVNGTSLATCKELNVGGAIFDNTLPGIYLPFDIYQKFMREVLAYADRHDFPKELRLWESSEHICYEGPVSWNKLPGISVTFFTNENEAFQVSYSGQSLAKRYYTKNSNQTTFCYIFAIRKTEDNHLIFGRTAFEGIKLIFNRSGRVLSFLENSCCGPNIKLSAETNGGEKMSSCLPYNQRSMILPVLESHWMWIAAIFTVASILTCIMSASKASNRRPPPTIHVFIPQTGINPQT